MSSRPRTSSLARARQSRWLERFDFFEGGLFASCQNSDFPRVKQTARLILERRDHLRSCGRFIAGRLGPHLAFRVADLLAGDLDALLCEGLHHFFVGDPGAMVRQVVANKLGFAGLWWFFNYSRAAVAIGTTS